MAGFSFNTRPDLAEALALLAPGASFRVDINELTGEYDYEGVVWDIAEGVDYTPPSKEVVEAYLEKIQLEWDTQVKYSVLRKDAYPSLEELADAVFWQAQGDNTKMEAYVAAVQAVKDTYTKNDPTLEWRGSASGTNRGALPSRAFQQNPNISLPDTVYTYTAPGVIVSPDTPT